MERYRTEAATDLAPELLNFLAGICLAQAQECILEKSILDHRKPQIIAKVGAQVGEFYLQARHKIGNVQLWLTLRQFCPLDGALIIASKDEFYFKEIMKNSIYTLQNICLHLSAVYLLFLSADFQLFAYIAFVSCLFTI